MEPLPRSERVDITKRCDTTWTIAQILPVIVEWIRTRQYKAKPATIGQKPELEEKTLQNMQGFDTRKVFGVNLSSFGFST